MEPLTWLHCGALLTGRGDDPQQDMAIGIRGGLIDDVRAWSSITPSAQRSAIDVSSYTIAPGLIDAHVHLLFGSGPDHDTTRNAFECATTAELALIGASNAAEALLGGITTVRDCGDTKMITLAIRDAIRKGTIPGPRVLTAGPPVTTTGGHLHWCGNKADNADEVRRAVRSLCTAGVDVVKLMASGGNMTLESNPLECQFTAEEMTIAVREARRFGKRVAAHAQNEDAIRWAVAAGVDTIEHCLWRDSVGRTGDVDELISLMKSSPATSVVLTMTGPTRALLHGSSRDSPAYSAGMAASPTGSLESDFLWARRLLDAGINVVLASDAGVRFTPFRRFGDSLQCGIEGLHATPSAAIALATSNAAKALGLEDEIGTIEPGKRADLVVFEGTGMFAQLGAVHEVYQDGRRVVAQGKLLEYPSSPSKV